MTQDNPSIRLFVAEPLETGALITLDEARAHYVQRVMRMREGEKLCVFNAQSGEWLATLSSAGKRSAQLTIGVQISPPRVCPDIWLAFAAIKNKNELVVEKATELGVRELHAIVTQHSVVKNINLEKLEAHAMEAAEQCERHDIPTITPHKNLASFLGEYPADRILLYGDETGEGKPLPEILRSLEAKKLCVLIGPEGGFSADEHRILKSVTYTVGFGLGPRILRADTAAVAALACVQAVTGDWEKRPHFKGKS